MMNVDAANLLKRLRSKYNRPGWICFDEFRNATGFTFQERYADLIAFGFWPSKGLKMIGFEIKVSRQDLQNELRRPEKAAALKKFCNEWFLVIPSLDILHNINMPADWGILVANNCGTLDIFKKASGLEPERLSRGIIASLLVRVREYIDYALSETKPTNRKDQK